MDKRELALPVTGSMIDGIRDDAHRLVGAQRQVAVLSTSDMHGGHPGARQLRAMIVAVEQISLDLAETVDRYIRDTDIVDVDDACRQIADSDLPEAERVAAARAVRWVYLARVED